MKFHSREEYEKIKKRDLADKWKTNCPFCDISKHQEFIIWEWKYFKIIHNKFPYGWLKNHLLVIPRRCISHTCKLLPNELSELPKINVFMKNFYWALPYFSFIREVGESKSIDHLHYHYLPGNIYDEPLEEMLKKQGIIKT